MNRHFQSYQKAASSLLKKIMWPQPEENPPTGAQE